MQGWKNLIIAAAAEKSICISKMETRFTRRECCSFMLCCLPYIDRVVLVINTFILINILQNKQYYSFNNQYCVRNCEKISSKNFGVGKFGAEILFVLTYVGTKPKKCFMPLYYCKLY